jgi:hypothetical protein
MSGQALTAAKRDEGTSKKRGKNFIANRRYPLSLRLLYPHHNNDTFSSIPLPCAKPYGRDCKYRGALVGRRTAQFLNEFCTSASGFYVLTPLLEIVRIKWC